MYSVGKHLAKNLPCANPCGQNYKQAKLDHKFIVMLGIKKNTI